MKRFRPAEIYFAPKFFETPRLYRVLGLDVVKRGVAWLGRRTGRDPTRPNNYFVWDRSSDGLRAFERRTRSNELMHLAGLALPLIGLLRGATGLLAAVLWIVLALNVFPFLLQRYHRLRIYRLLDARDSVMRKV